jgi:hypothetical protein
LQSSGFTRTTYTLMMSSARKYRFKCLAEFPASFRSTDLWLLPGASLAVYCLVVSVSGCAQMTPVRENYYESAAAISVPASCIPSSDLPIPSSFGKSACYPSQGGSAVSRPTQGGFLPLVPGRIVVRPETTGPIPSTSPMLTPPQGSMVMPGGGFYPMH